MQLLDLIQSRGVYFYFPEKVINLEARHYASDVLAAGLHELGIPCSSNAENPLFAACAIADCSAAVVVFYVTDDVYSEQLMQAIAEFNHPRKLILTMSDNANFMWTPPLVRSLVTHQNTYLRVKGARSPWAFGLSKQRIAAGAAHSKPFSERGRRVLRMFRPSANQSVRDSLDLLLLPWLERHFEIDRTIAVPGYYERMGSGIACLAYGGQIVPDLQKNGYFALKAEYKRMAEYISFEKDPIVIRWDSWRLWESFASGCLTFNVDMEKYGLQLPEAPRPWKDYIPVDFSDPKGTVEHFMDLEKDWPEIADNGRLWALSHYAPGPTAMRFLRIVKDSL